MSFNYNTSKFNYVDLTETANSRLQKCRGNVLDQDERTALEAAWAGVSYGQIAIEYGDSPSYITKVARKLWRQLSEYFGFKVNKTNVISTLKREWIQDIQAIYAANIKLDIGFTESKFLKLVSELILPHRGERLKGSEVVVLCGGCWKNKFYLDLAMENNYYEKDIREVGERLLEQLSEVLGEEVNKNNCKSVLEQRWRQQVQGNLIQNQTQLEDRSVESVDDARNNLTDGETTENANDSFDVNRLVEDTKNKLGQMISLFLDKDKIEANSQAVSKEKSDLDLEFTSKKLLETADNVIWQHHQLHLGEIEKLVLKENIWNNQTRVEIVEKDVNKYNPSYLDNEASKLCKLLSEALGAKVSRTTCKSALRRQWQENNKANLTSAPAQIEDCLFNFSLNPWNSCDKFIGNVENSWKYLVQDTANKIWQSLSEVWQRKVTPENWQAALQPKFHPDTKLTKEIALQFTNNVIFHCRGEHLHYLQEEIAYGAWQGKTYKTIAEEIDCDRDHLSAMAGELWQKLSEVFAFSGCKISKRNFKSTLERWYEDMRSSFSGFT